MGSEGWPSTAEALMRSRFVRERGRWYYLDAEA
jgi:uncharacterized protein YchJ